MAPFIVTINFKDQVLQREISKESFTVGRALDCDLHLNDNLISRVHVTISLRDGVMMIEDKNSSNGTFINGALLAKGVPFEIHSYDQIQLGTSGYTISAKILGAPDEQKPVPQQPPAVEEPASHEGTPKIPFSSDRVISDAKKRAAQIILEGEAQAERKAQSIFEKARKMKEEAEEFYESHMEKAHKDADALLSDFQRQGEDLLHEARSMASNLREEVESYVESVRKKSKIELEEAKSQAHALGLEQGKKDSESLIALAREEAARILERTQAQQKELQEKVQSDTAQLAKVTEELEASLKKRDREKFEIDKISEQYKNLTEEFEAESGELKKLKLDLEAAKNDFKNIENETKSLQKQKEDLSKLVDELNEKKSAHQGLSEQLDRSILESGEKLKNLQSQIEQAIEREKGLSESLKSEEIKLQELKTETQHLHDEKKSLDSIVSELRSEDTTLKAAIEESKTLLSSGSETINKLKLELSAVESELSVKKDLLQNIQLQESEVSSQLQKEQLQYAEIRESHQKLSEENRSLSESVKSLREEKDKTTSFLAETKVALLSETDTLKTLRADTQLVEANLKEVRADFEKVSTLSTETKKVLAKDESRLSEVQNLIEKGTARNRELEVSVSSLSEKQTRLSASVQDLETKRAQAQDQHQKSKAELEKVLEQLSLHKAELEGVVKREKETAALLKKEEISLSEVRSATQTLSSQKKSLEEAVSSLADKQAKLIMSVQEFESKKAQVAKEFESQRALLSEKFEKDKAQMHKQEQERAEEARLEVAKKMQKLEQDLLDSIIGSRNTLVKEIHSAIATEVVQIAEVAQWRQIAPSVETRIQEVLDGKVVSLAQSTTTGQKAVDLAKKRKKENFRWVGVGLVAGVAAIVIAQNVAEYVARDNTPMQTQVVREVAQRQKELEERRFNPPQVDELKESYVDAVIYTRGFVRIYTEEEFQQRLYKELSQYMLKTWRLEEEATLQALSASNALVKDLAERKTKIHPDFVKDGLDKMHAQETETLSRMKDILGSEVRLESFQRFERNFFTEEMDRRATQQP